MYLSKENSYQLSKKEVDYPISNFEKSKDSERFYALVVNNLKNHQ
jgi:hypothetical protein